MPRDLKVPPFDNLGPKFWEPSPKTVGGQKRAKFRSTSDNFILRSRISPKRMEISEIGKLSDG